METNFQASNARPFAGLDSEQRRLDEKWAVNAQLIIAIGQAEEKQKNNNNNNELHALSNPCW